jgi:hypothetical protein
MPDANGSSDYSLKTLSADGAVPECRMRDARHVVDLCRRLWDNDQRRSWVRSRTAGLIGGNPPFRNSKVAEANALGRANANWGTARSYMESASGSYYDLFTEAPGLVEIRTSYGKTPVELETYSRMMSEVAGRKLKENPLFDYTMQQSQWEMVLFGCGPLVFEDMFRVLPRSVHCGDLKVPERTRSDTAYFEVASIDVDWYPPELYSFVSNPDVARQAGWRTRYTTMVIANAMDIRTPDQRTFDWEFYQQEIKNNSLSYYDDSKINRCSIVFWLEFTGRVTQAIVEREPTTKDAEYLFIHVNRYANWNQCLHPMYFDRGHGGYHHSVVGAGVKMYAPMSLENRLLCNLYDKAQAPDILFKPNTTESMNKFQMAHMSQFGIVPAGFEVIQTPVKGFVSDGLAMYKTSSELMKSNLSTYRQQVPAQQSGNPPTKFQKQLEAQQASALSNTSYNRYYQQLDLLYEEIVRRMFNINSTDTMATEIQRECLDMGVPKECFGRIKTVRAQRVVGQGSPFLRREAISALSPFVSSFPEDGKRNWMNDYIASHCGQSSVDRYNPQPEKQTDDQDERVANAIASMKVGVPVPVVSSQNALRFAAGFLNACVQAISSVKQGANPAEVLKFLDIAAPAIMAHVKRVINDPTRADAAQAIADQWEQMSKIADQLRKMVQQQQQRSRQQQQKTQAAMSDQEIKAQKVRGDLALKAQKQQQTLALKEAHSRQQLAISDAHAANEIMNKNRLTSAKE